MNAETKQALGEMKEALEKEKKNSRELQKQNVKLNSLVKIGQESLQQEQQRANELQAQLKMRNGSVSTPCLNSTNGSPDDASTHQGSDGNTCNSSTSLNQVVSPSIATKLTNCFDS